MTNLADVLSKIGFQGLEDTVVPPNVPTDPLNIGPPMSEEEAAEALGYYDDGPEELLPAGQPIPQQIVESTKLDMGSHTLTIQLKALSDIMIDLVGLEGITLVINPGGLQARIRMEEENFSIGFTFGLGVRFGANILRPLRRTTDESGRVHFEDDESRAYTQIN